MWYHNDATLNPIMTDGFLCPFQDILFVAFLFWQKRGLRFDNRQYVLLSQGILCSNKWSYAFFVRGSVWGYALFLWKGGERMSDTMGTREASDKWGYSQATIASWCKAGKIDGAVQYRNRGPWAIPKDAECPKTIKKKEERIE